MITRLISCVERWIILRQLSIKLIHNTRSLVHKHVCKPLMTTLQTITYKQLMNGDIKKLTICMYAKQERTFVFSKILPSREVGDVDKGVVEAGENMGNAENNFSLSHLRSK